VPKLCELLPSGKIADKNAFSVEKQGKDRLRESLWHLTEEKNS
jgi:hypothetical protein